MDSIVRIGAPAPDFSLLTPEGTSYRLSEARDNYLVLNFWSLDCPHSERADEALLEIAAEWGSMVEIWSIASNANENPTDIARVAKSRGVTTLLLDSNQQVADLYQAESTPHIFVIDPDGMLIYRGALDDVSFRQRTPTRNYLTEVMTAIREAGSSALSETPAYGCAIVRHLAETET